MWYDCLASPAPKRGFEFDVEARHAVIMCLRRQKAVGAVLKVRCELREAAFHAILEVLAAAVAVALPCEIRIRQGVLCCTSSKHVSKCAAQRVEQSKSGRGILESVSLLRALATLVHPYLI